MDLKIMATDVSIVSHLIHSHEPAVPTNASPKRRILLVDDSTGATQLMARLLGMLGHQVSVAHDGEGAIATALHTRPNVVLLDLNLPDMSGFDVARALRLQAELANSLLVALTGHSDSDTRAEASAAGFDEFIVKPAAIETLESLLEHPKLAMCTG
jgi:DNA-binding response OmpR family regulator